MLSEEIIGVVERAAKRSFDREKVSHIVLSYFGFGNINRPTLEAVGNEYGCLSRERIRQIVKKYFVNSAVEDDLPSARFITDIIKRKPCWVAGDFKKAIESYVGSSFDIYGVMNFLDTMQYVEKLDFYKSDFTKVSQDSLDDTCILCYDETFKPIRREYLKILKRPGRLGLFRFDIAIKQLEKTYDSELLYRLLENNRNSRIICKEYRWYLLEDRDNVIKNTLAKIVNVTDSVRVDVLCDILYSVISKRSSDYPIPDTTLLREYLECSGLLRINNNYAFIQLNKGKLNDIDSDIIEAYSEEETSVLDYRSLYDKLQIIRGRKGLSPYTDAYLKKIYSSALIHKEDTDSRRNYRLVFVKYYSCTDGENDEYQNAIIPLKMENKLFESQLDAELIADLDTESITSNLFEHRNVPKEKSEQEIREIKSYKRSRIVSINALSYAKFTCENPGCDHTLFRRKHSNVPYTEPHHLIPLAFSDMFDYSLDVEENIVSLCSSCHNQLHYGLEYEELLYRLYDIRKNELGKVGLNITYEELKQMYE